MKEEWKTIKDFENYQVSNTGKIRNTNYNNTRRARELKPKVNKKGFLEVTLSKYDKKYYRLLSRLIITTFLNIELGRNDIIMYLNGNKGDCSLENMYLITRGERQEISYDTDRRYVKKYEFYGENLPIKEISKKTEMNRDLIINRISKLYWNIYEASEIPKSIFKGGKTYG